MHAAMRRAPLAATCTLLALACGGGGDPPVTPDAPVIVAIDYAAPAVVDTPLHVTASRVDGLGAAPLLELRWSGGDATLPLSSRDATGMRFALGAANVASLGDGSHSVDAVLVGSAGAADAVRSGRYSFTLEVATLLTPRLDTGLFGDVHRNELAVLGGAGFVEGDEGDLVAHFVGDFTPDGGGRAPVDARIDVALAERFSRSRGTVALTTDLGGPEPGHFVGSVALVTTPAVGPDLLSERQDVDLVFLPPEVFGLDPTRAALEQVVDVRGAGFLGGPDRPDEVTLLRLDGVVEGDGVPATSFDAVEIVPEFAAGDSLLWVMTSRADDANLVSELFGVGRGSFTGTLTPIAIDGTVEVEGPAANLTLALSGVTQVVHLRFLPSFFESLPRFGLAAAAGELEARVARRIREIYSDWSVEVRTEVPTDFSANGYAVVEIGGPDPNGIGLFGYDNSPGKDIGNLRLFDAIGGANAETQADGFPGFGGVFVESFLYWSSHPDLPGEAPAAIPPEEPLFDEIFEAVRTVPASLAEVQRDGAVARVEVVQRALDALANVIGETAAHEIGHSLGLADPFGPATSFHNRFDDPGCLMDSGGARPFGERAGEPGFGATRFCGDGPDYLDAILRR